MTSNTLRRAVAVGTILMAVSLGTAPAFGYRMIQKSMSGPAPAGIPVTCDDPGGFVHWGSSNLPIQWYLNTTGQGAGKDLAFMNAMAVWTNVPGADHTLFYAGTTTAGWVTDGQNTALWAQGNGCTGACLALTALVLQPWQVIVETDITFNSLYTWRVDGANYDTQAIATHELGHTLGIHHTELTSTPRPTMYAAYFGVTGRTLESDDILALQCAQSRYP